MPGDLPPDQFRWAMHRAADLIADYLEKVGDYPGSAAICPEYRALMPGIERADSIVVNPHKWLFTPVDCSILWVKDPALLRAAFSLVPDYLRTDEPGVTNLMDTGFQLGRRFRALKLWMVIRAFGVEGLQERIREHCAIARELAAKIEADPRFELAAPVPFSTVCFRALGDDRFNERLLARVNAAGPSSSRRRRSTAA